MKPSYMTVATVVALAFGLSASAFAAPDPILGQNYSNVTQSGSGNGASVDQTIGTESVGNSSTIEQIGTDNQVYGLHFTGTDHYDVDMDPVTDLPMFYSSIPGVTQSGTGGTLNKSKIHQKTSTGGAVSGNKAVVIQEGASNTNVSTINQQSDGNIAGVFQGMYGSNNKYNKATIIQSGSTAGGATGNIAGIAQEGVGDLDHANNASISQNGNSNDAFTKQGGTLSDNDSETTQIGTSNDAEVVQYGNGNDNYSEIHQNGSYNVAEVEQSGAGNNNDATINQSGDHATAIVDQSGQDNWNYANIIQTAGSYAEVTQQGSGNENTANIYQYSGGNSAIVLQEGNNLSNNSTITQSAGANSAYVHQH